MRPKHTHLHKNHCAINRRLRQRLYLAMGVLSLGVWLVMATAEVWTPLHAWLHGGKIPLHDDHCAIVAIAHGKVETVAVAATVPVPITWIEVTPRVAFTALAPVSVALPSVRGPPATPSSPV